MMSNEEHYVVVWQSGGGGGGAGARHYGYGKLEGRRDFRDPHKPCITRVSHHAEGRRDALEPN